MTCECVICQTAREFAKDEPDVKELEKLSDWMLEKWGAAEQSLAYLLHETVRFAERSDCPAYLREAVEVVRNGG